MKYIYYNSSGAITPSSGLPPTLNGGEYNDANRGSFDFQFVVVGKDDSAARTIYTAITQNLVAYTFAIKSQYSSGPRDSASVRVTMDTSNNGPYFYPADPFILPPKSAAGSIFFGHEGAVQLTTAVTLFLSVVLLFLMY